MKDSVMEHDRAKWDGLDEMLALSAVGDVSIPELDVVGKEEVLQELPITAWNPVIVGQRWTWSLKASEMASWVDVEPCSSAPPLSPMSETSPPREEVVQASSSWQPAQGPPTCGSHSYADLTMDDRDE
ncbi:histone-lysine n-methyltransferase atxr3 [Hordeum vulgare]|nr:histone-lysine n-methyltransferase atxr3 [Hordeum vulgare]